MDYKEICKGVADEIIKNYTTPYGENSVIINAESIYTIVTACYEQGMKHRY